MKTRNFLMNMAGTLMLAGAMLTACTEGDGEADDSYIPGEKALSADVAEGGPGTSGTGSDGNTLAGIVTAGEWNDLQHWPFWSRLMLDDQFSDKSDYWLMYTNNRVAVSVTNEGGQPVAGVSVKLQRSGSTVWETVTDNHGLANCWPGFCQKEEISSESLSLIVDGQPMAGHPVLCPWDSLAQQPATNHYVVSPSKAVSQRADIAFVVDATGSMGDEINFLKSDLADIIVRASQAAPGQTLRTAALFYRDEGDEYVTRHSDFTEDLDQTASFVNEQNANGGGDYPEAVHTALENTLQNLSWDAQARTRLAFLILDAPAHHASSVIQSLQQSVTTFARLGIRLVPVAASGVDKNTEFMCRFFAIATGGTYVFLTNDSGVGNHHIQATVGDYEVEQLNDLLIRLIGYYTE